MISIKVAFNIDFAAETLETCEDEFGRSGLRFPLLTVGGSILRLTTNHLASFLCL